MGIEIGFSALVHDGDIDVSVEYDSILAPGGKKIIKIELTIASPVNIDKNAGVCGQ